MTGLGQREAYGRIAYPLCEWIVRLRAVGLVQDHSCDLPMTRHDFADALGLTAVHINRVLQHLRSDGLIQVKGLRLTTPDWEKLKKAGDFDPAFFRWRTSRKPQREARPSVQRVATVTIGESLLLFDES